MRHETIFENKTGGTQIIFLKSCEEYLTYRTYSLHAFSLSWNFPCLLGTIVVPSVHYGTHLTLVSMQSFK